MRFWQFDARFVVKIRDMLLICICSKCVFLTSTAKHSLVAFTLHWLETNVIRRYNQFISHSPLTTPQVKSKLKEKLITVYRTIGMNSFDQYMHACLHFEIYINWYTCRSCIAAAVTLSEWTLQAKSCYLISTTRMHSI